MAGSTRTTAGARSAKNGSRLGERAVIAVLRLANTVTLEATALLKRHGLTLNQYNALRILRGAGDGGATCGEISERMLTRDPDITRLLDRLERTGFAVRSREASDRRIVTTRITESGVELLSKLDAPVVELDRRIFAALDDSELGTLIARLEAVLGS